MSLYNDFARYNSTSYINTSTAKVYNKRSFSDGGKITESQLTWIPTSATTQGHYGYADTGLLTWAVLHSSFVCGDEHLVYNMKYDQSENTSYANKKGFSHKLEFYGTTKSYAGVGTLDISSFKLFTSTVFVTTGWSGNYKKYTLDKNWPGGIYRFRTVCLKTSSPQPLTTSTTYSWWSRIIIRLHTVSYGQTPE